MAMRNLRTLRRIAGYTQRMLATRARIRLSHIANVEARRADYTKAERRRILAACLNAAQQNFESLRAELEAEAIGETLPG